MSVRIGYKASADQVRCASVVEVSACGGGVEVGHRGGVGFRDGLISDVDVSYLDATAVSDLHKETSDVR